MIFAINNESLYTNYLKGLGSKRKKELDNVSNLEKKIKKYNKTADSIKEFNTIDNMLLFINKYLYNNCKLLNKIIYSNNPKYIINLN